MSEISSKYIRQVFAVKAVDPEKPQALESQGGRQFFQELASLDRERDPELFWSGAIRAVERFESRRRDGQLPAILGIWLANPELSPELRRRLERKLEESQGRGSFGARAEYFISHFNRQAFDAKTLAPMLAAGLLGKVVQTAALGRLTAAAPAWWSRGWLARSAALSVGFGSEVAVLGTAHGEFGRSALSLAAMKVGLWGGAKTSLPIPLTLVGATMLGLKAEEKLGWRTPSSLSDALADAGASALSFGVGMSLASRILGPRFLELQHRLALAQRYPTGFPGPGSVFHPRLASVPGFVPPAELLAELPKPMLMSGDSGFDLPRSAAKILERSIPNSSGPARPFELILSPENRRPFQTTAEGLEGQRMIIARRDGSPLWVKIDKKALNQAGDPITPAGVVRVNFRLEEGDTRGRAFIHYDSKALTLSFIDLEESMITGGPAMRAGTGSVFMTWLAEQARSQGRSFNVTRITSPQTVRIMEKMELVGSKCRVEACARLNPEAYDEEYRVFAKFPFGDRSSWGQHRRDADFFNVFGGE